MSPRLLTAGCVVGQEFVRAVVAFLTNDVAAGSSSAPAVITEADAEYGSRALDNGPTEPIAAALAVS
jgi:hypothetical protein